MYPSEEHEINPVLVTVWVLVLVVFAIILFFFHNYWNLLAEEQLSAVSLNHYMWSFSLDLKYITFVPLNNFTKNSYIICICPVLRMSSCHVNIRTLHFTNNTKINERVSDKPISRIIHKIGQVLEKRLVFVPTDKVVTNEMMVWRKYYTEILKNETIHSSTVKAVLSI